MSITFETKVWENDWQLIMNTSRLEKTINRCYYNFDKKVLYINNVNDTIAVINKAKELVYNGIIDSFIDVSEYSSAALEYFNLNKDKLGKGYYYSIAELVSIYLTNTTYILHLSGDTSIMPNISCDWVKIGIETLENHANVKVFNLNWDYKHKGAKSESYFENKNCFFGYGFSDQMYLIRTCDFKQRIYEYYDAASERYPKYGGELFEKRVDSWMQQNNYLRATYKHGSYIHKNFRRNRLLKSIAISIDKINLFR